MEKFWNFFNGQILKFLLGLGPTAVVDEVLHYFVTSLLFTGNTLWLIFSDFLVGEWTTLGNKSIFRNFSRAFSKFHHEDDGIFQFFKRIRIPHFFLDFWVGEWTTLEKISIFRNYSRVFSKFRGEDGTFLLLRLWIRILWFFCYFLVWDRTKSKVSVFSFFS